jgi:enterochelin esterase family protein
MKTPSIHHSLLTAALLTASALTSSTFAQAPAKAGPEGVQQAMFADSPVVSPERQITFRIFAPKAENVRLSGPDLPGLGQGAAMTRDTNGLWEVTVGPINSGAYRYNFNVDGLSVIDPRNPAPSESNENTWSLVYVPGSDFMDTKDVPHGAVSEVIYYSTTLKRFRRMHVYTPPGYELGKGQYPVFYLLHGAWDSDDAWTSIGRAGFIFDNLIAAGKAKPMVVVMPAGHTGPFHAGMSFSNDFERDFLNDVMPLVEKRYRVRNDRKDRAIAGLSMGGAQTLNIGMAELDKFGYLGVFSSGVFSLDPSRHRNAPEGPSWEEKNKASLDDPKLKPGLALVWFATGKEDSLLKTSQATVALLQNHGFNVVYNESEGGHTWINWREYLNEFAPLLFQ